MASETPEQEPEEPTAEQAASETAEEKPKRARRSTKAAAEGETREGGAEASAAKPKRSRAKKAVPEAATEADEKPKRARAKKAEPEASTEAEEKPKRSRAKRGEATKAKKPSESDAAEKASGDEKAEPAEKPKRSRGAESAPAPRAVSSGSSTVVRAQARYVRTSARKARMVCGHLRGKSVDEARAILAFTPRAVARDWSKLLESAVANAENNHELVEEDLVVREAYADEGPTIKRFRPRARGRAAPIRKRTSHLTITLTPGD